MVNARGSTGGAPRRAPLRASFAALALASSAPACSTKLTFLEPEPGWERMQVQPRADAYSKSDAFADGKVMQTPPPGAIAKEAVVGAPGLTRGLEDNAYLDHIPLPVDRAMVVRGRQRFDIFCAPCHGVAGDGVSIVATKMSLRKPPSLYEDRLLAYRVGAIYQVVTEGYGLMPGYAAEIGLDDRWAVVAYVRALQASRHSPVEGLPANLRAEIAREAP